MKNEVLEHTVKVSYIVKAGKCVVSGIAFESGIDAKKVKNVMLSTNEKEVRTISDEVIARQAAEKVDGVVIKRTTTCMITRTTEELA